MDELSPKTAWHARTLIAATTFFRIVKSSSEGLEV